MPASYLFKLIEYFSKLNHLPSKHYILYAVWSTCFCSWPLNVHISRVTSGLADLVNTILGSKALNRSIWSIFFNGASAVMLRSNRIDPWTCVGPQRFISSIRPLTLTWTRCFLLHLGPFSPYWIQSALNHWGWQRKRDRRMKKKQR